MTVREINCIQRRFMLISHIANRKGKPFAFKLGSGEVIKGWDIGVAGMSVRAERRITIPAHLGYGSQNMPGIPPNSNLIFEVKMLSIEAK